jgi:hypothetical protein
MGISLAVRCYAVCCHPEPARDLNLILILDLSLNLNLILILNLNLNLNLNLKRSDILRSSG